MFANDEAKIGAMVSFANAEPASAGRARTAGAGRGCRAGRGGSNTHTGDPGRQSVLGSSLPGWGPPLLALEANFFLNPKAGQRLVPAEQFFLGPRRTVLQPGEILTEILVPLREDFKAKFLRMGRRKALTLSIVNAAAGVTVEDGGRIGYARIALGAVAPTPIRAYKAEQLLQGQRITSRLLAEAAAVAATETSPISDLRASADYRRKISAVLVRRALENAIEQTRQAGVSIRVAAGGSK